MKNIVFGILVICLIPVIAFGQLKKQSDMVDIKNDLIKYNDNSFLGLNFLDLSKLKMSHSYSLSYFSMGDVGVSQSLYLNTISYQLANPLLVKLQWGIQNFPYTSLGNNNPAFKGGFVFSGMELKYKPSDKFMMKFEYNALPRTGYYNPYYRDYFWEDEE